MREDQLHHRITSLADELQEHHTVIASGHPADNEGFTRPADPDLRDAMRAIEYAISVLTRVAYKISQEGIDPPPRS